MTTQTAYAVQMTGISKQYGDVRALDDVSIHVEKGTLHAIVGENGAGKTTLMKALYGAMQPDSGEILLDGKPVKFANSAAAIQSGIGMVSQHYGIIGELTCLENLILGAETGAILDRSSAEKRAVDLATRMGFQFDWNSDASTLSPAQAQKLEILKLLWRNAQIMILDEPTAMLSPSDADQLFDSLKRLASEGATILIVTHRLPEVLDSSKNVTVLRGGKLIIEREVAGINGRELAELIVGGAVIEPGPSRILENARPVLQTKTLSVKGPKGNLALKNCDLTLCEGELVGIAGVDGNGQRELFRALIGIENPTEGTIHFNKQEWTRKSTQARISDGLRMIPEDRHEEAVIEDWSLMENASLGLQRLPLFQKLSKDERKTSVQQVVDLFRTKFGTLADPMASLSGGNQQRFVAARALLFDPKLVLAFQPARGLDLNSTARVYQKLREVCEAGCSALVVSFDLDELLEYCDRIVVLNHGVLEIPPKGHEKDREWIGQRMVGAA